MTVAARVGWAVATAVAVVACGSAGSVAPSRAGGAGDPEAIARVETAQERRIRIAKAKRHACQTLGAAIERSQEHDTIINVNDTGSVRQMARQLEQAAGRIDDIEVDPADLGALVELRDRYTATTRAMAKALQQVAKTKSGDAQRAAVREFGELEPQLAGHIADMNDYCNAPVE